jgi:TetR/AcrR family transcriptional regulator, cholesterol catabolism regulator
MGQPARTRRHGQNGHPREVILDAATRLFSEKGYAGTTMRDIANAVGVLPGSLYAHIEAKELLLLEIVEAGIDRYLMAGDGLDTVAAPVDRLHAAVRSHVAVVAESPQRALVVFHQWRFLSGPNRARIVDKRGRYEQIFATLIDDGVRAGVFSDRLDRRVAVRGLLGALNWTAEWYRPDGPAPTEVLADRLADAFLWGLLRSER